MATAIELLKSYSACVAEIKEAESELEQWRSRCEIAQISLARVSGGGGNNNPLDVLADLARTLRDRLVNAAAKRLEIESCINSVNDVRLRSILKRRYIFGQKWEEIAEILGYDNRWLMRLHQKALSALPV